ncbi:hypothetical protein PtA15_9A647 [Puccinia triticina]|uniref:Uncharacterized protein n=1 Tax=Puccinia triticina TaxID=208348 RepID=A0ABY7CXK6_9BASI|nr:uncharacterized protein PtA15_9A647 [Puccinia triticina]WAQ88520.1 hypothetical protein PtA15_9A647 [Puccinia triticina]
MSHISRPQGSTSDVDRRRQANWPSTSTISRRLESGFMTTFAATAAPSHSYSRKLSPSYPSNLFQTNRNAHSDLRMSLDPLTKTLVLGCQQFLKLLAVDGVHACQNLI